MLRAHVTRTLGSSNVNFTVTHGLGAVPDFWHLEPRSDVGLGASYVMPGSVLTNAMTVRSPLASTASLDIWVINYQGRLY